MDEQKLPEYLYQYRKINENTLSALINHKMWLAHPSTFNDPFDSTYYYEDATQSDVAWTQEILQCYNDETEPKLAKLFKKFFIICFSTQPDNILMWSHYADCHKGLCIKYKTKRDKQVINQKYIHLQIKGVSYKEQLDNKYTPGKYAKNTNSPEAEDNAKVNATIEILSTKSKDWTYEGEWRLIRHPSIPELNSDSCFEGKLIDFPDDMLEIEEIYFGCRCTDENIATIKQIFKDKNKTIKFLKYKDMPGRTPLESEPLE